MDRRLQMRRPNRSFLPRNDHAPQSHRRSFCNLPTVFCLWCRELWSSRRLLRKCTTHDTRRRWAVSDTRKTSESSLVLKTADCILPLVS